MKIHIEPHNPDWIVEFAKSKEDLQQILKDIPIISIEHVGSTSVPGLIAKPVLDIAIIVTGASLPLACTAIENASYTPLGEIGIEDRFAFRQPGFKKGQQANGVGVEGAEMRRNTYVTVDGCLSLRNQMDVKRILLEDRALRDEYAGVKRELVEKGVGSVDEYCRGKTGCILRILKRAGWGNEDLDEVRTANL